MSLQLVHSQGMQDVGMVESDTPTPSALILQMEARMEARLCLQMETKMEAMLSSIDARLAVLEKGFIEHRAFTEKLREEVLLSNWLINQLIH